jgi:uncharacterized protein (DUF305 family)
MNFSVFLMTFSLITSSSCKEHEADQVSQAKHFLSVKNEITQSVEKAAITINNTSLNGDFDYDFANLMIMQHQIANEMSRIEIKKGKDEIIKKMANGIIVAQEIEIRQMQQFLKSYKIVITQNQVSNSYKITLAMKAMIERMSKMNRSENVDKDYVAMMIPHHKSAVLIANQQLKFGREIVLLELSKNIIEDQGFEIQEFKKWQAKN